MKNFNDKVVQDVCEECDGKGWYSGSEAGHDCDGTEESCNRNCPIQIQTKVGCEICGGSGREERDVG